MTKFHDWEDVRAELHDGDETALEAERAWTLAWMHAYHLAEERRRLGLTQRDVARLMNVTPGRVSQIENGDLEANEVATLGRYAQALGRPDAHHLRLWRRPPADRVDDTPPFAPYAEKA